MRAGLLLVVLLVASALAPTAVAEEQDQGLQAVLSESAATYGSESWKDVNATVGQVTSGSPVPAPGPSETGVYSNPYSSPDHAHQQPDGNHLGYRFTGNVTLVTADGGSPPSDKNYYIEAWIEAAAGQVPARLAKVSNDTFEVVADLDGENRHGYPALTFGGSVNLEVEVYEDPADPVADPQVVATETFALENHRGSSDPAGTIFPEAQIPGYTDVGPTNFTELKPSVVDPNERRTATFTFPGADKERITASLYRGTTETPVFTGRTGPNGTVSFPFTPNKALPQAADTGLLVLEAHLEGDQRVLGSQAVALPVSPHPMNVQSIQHEKRSGGSLGNASTVQVTVEDSNANPSNNSRRGQLYILKGTDVLEETSYGTGGSDPALRSARYPASAVEGYTSYDLVSLFYDDQDNFYSLATAHRGAAATLSIDDPVEPNRQATLEVTVTNENDNGNPSTDPGLVLTGEIKVRNLPGASDVVQDQVIVPEGESRTAEIPHTPVETGTHDFTVNVTADEISLDLVGAVEVQESGVVDDILAEDDLLETPAAGPAPLLVAGAALALALRRRRD
jgi:hypothetical protein